MEKYPEGQGPDRDELQRMLLEQLKAEGKDTSKMSISFDMVEDVMVMGLAGGFIHNLNYIDDPIFFEAVNAMLGTEDETGESIPVEDMVHSKVPMSLSGYGLLDANDHLIGFAYFESQVNLRP